MRALTFTLVLAASTIIGGCGGGGESSGSTVETPAPITPQNDIFTGMFIDTAVQGLNYETATQSGKTNEQGEFSYQNGEQVTFSIGSIMFESVLSKAIITPLDIFNTDNIQTPSVVNMLRLLQTLDDDGDLTNGIQITDEVHALAQGLTVDFSAQDFEAQVSQVVLNNPGIIQHLISPTDAIYHFEQTLESLGVAQSSCPSDHPKVGFTGFFQTRSHNVAGMATITSNCTIEVTNFTYDGQGPDVYFYAAIDQNYQDPSAFAISGRINGQPYNNETLILRLPIGKMLDDLTSISVWCVDFNANFGDLTFTAP